MARIAGVDIPREKRVEVALTYIFGIGLPTAQKILTQTNINADPRVRDLTEEQVNRLRELIDRRYKVEGDPRREVALNIKRLTETGTYPGMPPRRNLPGRGPATNTKPCQRRGPEQTGGAGSEREARRWPDTPNPSAGSAAGRARSSTSRGAAATPRSAPSSADPRRPASTASAAARSATTGSSCGRSRRSAASTASSSDS